MSIESLWGTYTIIGLGRNKLMIYEIVDILHYQSILENSQYLYRHYLHDILLKLHKYLLTMG